MPLTACCSLCSNAGSLLRCSGCKVVLYCTKDHQIADRGKHKSQCNLIKKRRQVVEQEEQKLRAHPGDFMTPANPFENSVGHFWGVLETRAYMRARYGLVEAILKIKTHDAVKSSLDHLLDMLRLCRSDNMGVRDIVPALMLRLGRDQGCYDFVKWWATCDQDGTYAWGDISLPYLSIKDADTFEPIDYLCSEFPHLAHIVSITLLKIKLLMDVKELQNSNVLGKKAPREVVDNIQRYLPKTSIVSENKEIMTSTDHVDLIEELSSQVDELYDTVDEANQYFWPALLSPGRNLEARPEAYSAGSVEEMQLVLQYSFDSWKETPGAAKLIEARIQE